MFTEKFGDFKPKEHNLLGAPVELEHRNLDRHGPGWEGVRDGVAGDGGWPLYLSRYAEVVAAST